MDIQKEKISKRRVSIPKERENDFKKALGNFKKINKDLEKYKREKHKPKTIYSENWKSFSYKELYH